MMNSTIEIPEIRVRLREWPVILLSYIPWAIGSMHSFLTHHWVNCRVSAEEY